MKKQKKKQVTLKQKRPVTLSDAQLKRVMGGMVFCVTPW